MKNKLVTNILFGVTALIFIIAVYFLVTMTINGAPDAYKPDQMGIELIDQGKATPANYLEEGQKAYDSQVMKIENNILSGVNFMVIVLLIAGVLMIGFLLYGLINTLRHDFKKGLPSLIFSGIVLLAFVWASMNSGDDTQGFESLVSKEGEVAAKSMLSQTNFWVNGLLFVFIPGALLLIVDLVWSIIKGYRN